MSSQIQKEEVYWILIVTPNLFNHFWIEVYILHHVFKASSQLISIENNHWANFRRVSYWSLDGNTVRDVNLVILSFAKARSINDHNFFCFPIIIVLEFFKEWIDWVCDWARDFVNNKFLKLRINFFGFYVPIFILFHWGLGKILYCGCFATTNSP